MIPPPVKRTRTLVSDGVVIVISVKSVAATFLATRTLPENSRVPVLSDQRQKVALYTANKIGRPLPGEMLLHDKLPTFHFRLPLLLSLRSTVQLGAKSVSCLPKLF